MPSTDPSAGQKRKRSDHSQHAASHDHRSKKRFQDRTILTQTADRALSRNGELNIAAFIKSREFEINALDNSIKKARQNLSSRAFQQVPRHLRRRTASHNAKKVPRRLRGRARKEMREDNTPTVNSKTRTPTSRLRLRQETAKSLRKLTQKRKTARQKKREVKTNAAESDPSKHVESVRIPKIKKNKLSDPPLATSKFKRRQVNKTWLPTHLWHAKRAHMTRPIEPLWRMAIPLRPTEKCYRATHRASASRGCVAWDMSYISTVGCLGTETAIEGLLKALGFHGHGWGGPKYRKWKTGSRFMNGWVGSKDGIEAIAMIDVLWCARKFDESTQTDMVRRPDEDVQVADEPPETRRPRTKLDRRILIRIHPSAFEQFWLNLLRMAKLQKPQVLVEDLRFEIGSMDIMGPASTEGVLKALYIAQADESTRQIWNSLPSISNPAVLPSNVVLVLDVEDPRFRHASKFPTLSNASTGQESYHETLLDWPLDAGVQPSALFSHRARHIASRLSSQWALNRRRQALLPGDALQYSTKDPIIPVVLLAHRSSNASGPRQGYWTLLAPWDCIDVIWRKLLHCPLSSGSIPRFGGLREKQQVAFEQNVPWYPGDFPGTEAGKSWERSEAEKRFDEWIRHPPSRRIAWERLDLGTNRRGEIGRGWACDWEYLFTDSIASTNISEFSAPRRIQQKTGTTSRDQPLLTQRQRKAAKAQAQRKDNDLARRRNTSSPESDAEADRVLNKDVPFMQLSPATAKSLLHSAVLSVPPHEHALATVVLTYIGKGTPVNAARIYRLPGPQVVSSLSTVAPMSNYSSSRREEPPIDSSSAGQASAHSKALSTGQISDLRSRWLALDVNIAPRQSTRIDKRDRSNHWGLPRKTQRYEAESLRHINILPKNAPPEIREQYGHKPPTDEDEKAILREKTAIRMKEEAVWESHVPCPGAEDLIGFVTSGGYNLADGRGTAMGAVWVQRLLSGWTEQETALSASTSQQVPRGKSTERKMPSQQKDRERHLCIVRNAGESIGRLAFWKVCE